MLAALNRKVQEADDTDRATTARIAAADNLLTRLENLEMQSRSFFEHSAADIELLKLDMSQVVSLTVNRQPLLMKRQADVVGQNEVRNELDPAVEGSFDWKTNLLNQNAADIRAQLDEPTRKYHEDQSYLTGWQERVSHIVGSAQESELISSIQAQLGGLDDPPRLIAI